MGFYFTGTGAVPKFLHCYFYGTPPAPTFARTTFLSKGLMMALAPAQIPRSVTTANGQFEA